MAKSNPVEQIDLALLKIAFPTHRGMDLFLWCEPLQAACRKWGIDTVREVASFLGNIAVESQDLNRLEENLNYSVEGLRKTFGHHRISDLDCQRFGRSAAHPANQEAIANTIYGGEWGKENLGNILPGDGWKFRGYGPKQITGRANHTNFAKAMGIRVEDVPAFIRTKDGGCMSAGWFWKSHNLDARAATPGWRDDRIAINGGTLGLDVVEDRADDLVRELLKRGC